MTIEVIDSHIQLTLECQECWHQWDIEDYDSVQVKTAIDHVENNEVCPICKEKDLESC
jgi:hypothetical protein